MTSPPDRVEPVVGRLSRFDGTTFQPVRPGSVQVPFVHVFVHGWQPGYRTQERLLATTDGVTALHAWDPRLVDATGRTLISDYLPLLEALAALGEDHAVLWYSWLDESATDADIFLAHRSRQATQINGRRLAVALQRATPDSRVGAPEQRLHLIGHSHGSAVVTHAAVSLGRAPEQLTLLDAPENPISRFGGAADLIDVVLPRLRPGRTAGRTFVDSYTSAFGRPYHRRRGLSSVVDVQLTPPLTFHRDPVRAINAAHLYAVDWYARSAREAARGVGFGWSPMRSAGAAGSRSVELEALRSAYYSALPNRPLDLRARLELPLAATATRLARTAVQRTAVDGVSLEVSPNAPAAAVMLTTGQDDQLVEFDIVVHGGVGDERIDLELDGVPSFRALARFPVPASGRYLMLADGRAGQHLLTARMSQLGVAGGRRAEDRAAAAVVAAAGPAPEGGPVMKVEITGLRLVSRPGYGAWNGAGYTPTRTLGAAFVAGAASGSLVTLVTLVATGWTARKALQVISRRRHR